MTLAAVIALLAVTSDPTDARARRKRHPVKHQQAEESYNPLYAAIVVDAKTGAVLHQSSPDSRRHPASLTKIMTLYLLFERLEAGKIKLGTALEVSEEASIQAPTKLGLKPGDTIRVEDAIGGLITKSANDAAVVVAEALAGSEEEFARQMTRKARALGMRHTVYRNASGLPNDEQVTTARDQALLGIAIQHRFPRYYRYFSTANYTYRGQILRNHNRLLGQVDGVDGIKTGYTRASGFNLVTSVRRDARHVVAVVLGGRSAPQRDARMRDLIGSHIVKASTKSAPANVAEAPEPEPAHAARQLIADAVSAPLSLIPPQVSEATATIADARPGSSAPIKPVPVKTLTVKLVPPKNAPQVIPVPVRSPVVTVAALETAPVEHAEVSEKPAEVAAPSPATKAADAPAPVRRSVRLGWVIQVGALDDEAQAKGRLNSAQRKAASLLEKADAYTERIMKDGKTYYRARFAGFDRDQAEAACRHLKRSDIPCMTLKI